MLSGRAQLVVDGDVLPGRRVPVEACGDLVPAAAQVPAPRRVVGDRRQRAGEGVPQPVRIGGLRGHKIEARGRVPRFGRFPS